MNRTWMDRATAGLGMALLLLLSRSALGEKETASKTPPAAPAEERTETMAVKIGAKAPAFTLPNAAGKETSLKDFAGEWLVLYFYPRDSTPGCTTEACEFTASIADFKNLTAKVVGVSPDSPESHRKFIEKYELAVTLLSDPSHGMMEKYGAWGMKKSFGVEKEGVIRSTVIVDPKGSVAFVWPTVTAKGHADEVKAKLEELQKTAAK